jgi:putative membrane protein insertion efficiency factor
MSSRSANPRASTAAARTGGWSSLVLVRLCQAPILIYRWTLKPFLGWRCRHLPTCSEYALEAIAANGPWRGLWLTVSRLSRCHRWGSAGFDPVPDISQERHPFAPWRYGRWTGRHIGPEWRWERTD